jgi:hypothetical protein
MHVAYILPQVKLKITARLPLKTSLKTLHCIALSHQHDPELAVPGRVAGFRNRIHVYMASFYYL